MGEILLKSARWRDAFGMVYRARSEKIRRPAVNRLHSAVRDYSARCRVRAMAVAGLPGALFVSSDAQARL